MRNLLLGLGVAAALAAGIPAAQAQDRDGHERDGVPKLDHVFLIVLENHNSFTSFGSNGILDNPQAPKITELAKKYNVNMRIAAYTLAIDRVAAVHRLRGLYA